MTLPWVLVTIGAALGSALLVYRLARGHRYAILFAIAAVPVFFLAPRLLRVLRGPVAAVVAGVAAALVLGLAARGLARRRRAPVGRLGDGDERR